MSAYNAGQLFGLVILALIVVGVVREILKKRAEKEDERRCAPRPPRLHPPGHQRQWHRPRRDVVDLAAAWARSNQ